MLKNFSLILLAAFFLVSACFLLTPHHVYAAFGVSPPFLGTQHLLKGSSYAQTIYLVQDNPSEDLGIDVRLNVPEKIRGWFTISDGKKIVIPKGMNQFPLTIAIKVPSDTELGVYHGFMQISGSPGATGQVTIALGAQIAIDFTVGNDIFRKFSVPVVQFPDIEEGWPPKVYVKTNNEGNVPESFDYATFELLDKFGAVRLAYLTKEKDFPETPPFTIGEFTVDFPTGFYISTGQYWGSVAFYQEGKVIASQHTILTVYPAGTFTGPWGKVLSFLRKYMTYEILGGVVLAGVLGIYVWKRRRTKYLRSRAG